MPHNEEDVTAAHRGDRDEGVRRRGSNSAFADQCLSAMSNGEGMPKERCLHLTKETQGFGEFSFVQHPGGPVKLHDVRCLVLAL